MFLADDMGLNTILHEGQRGWYGLRLRSSVAVGRAAAAAKAYILPESLTPISLDHLLRGFSAGLVCCRAIALKMAYHDYVNKVLLLLP